MRKRPKRPQPADLAGRCHAARWAEPTPVPSVLGLVVAAMIGATAAGSWTLSTWIASGAIAEQPRASDAGAGAPVVSSMAGTGEVRLVPRAAVDTGG